MSYTKCPIQGIRDIQVAISWICAKGTTKKSIKKSLHRFPKYWISHGEYKFHHLQQIQDSMDWFKGKFTGKPNI
jgi:hypothetical protein